VLIFSSVHSIYIDGSFLLWMSRSIISRWKLRKELFIKNFKENEYRYKSPITLIDFHREGDATDAIRAHASSKFGGWRISDDGTIGGKSKAILRLIKSEKDLTLFQDVPWQKHLEMDEKKEDELDFFEKDGSSIENVKNGNNFTPFIRWKGEIDTTLPKENREINRSGFCTIQSPSFSGFLGSMILPYNAIEIVCRSDGRNYFVNLKIDSWLPDNMIQAVIRTKPSMHPNDDFFTFVLPFRNFVQTCGGRIRSAQLRIEDKIAIEHFGLTLADGDDGEFEFDLARVRAINYFDGEILLDNLEV